MKTYKDFETEYIGSSDIATLIMVGNKKENGMITDVLHSEEMTYTVLI